MRYKDENKKESIFTATIQLINEIGFSDTSMSKIAKKASVSPSTIYVYFKNKNDMINKLYLTIKQKMSQEMFHDINASTPIKVGFESVFRNYINFLLNHKDYFLFIEQFANSPLIQNLSREESLNLFSPMYQLFEKGKSKNIFKEVDTNILIIYAYTPINQVVKACLNEEFKLNDEKIEKIIQMSWDAIRIY
ncbi:TetR/AcrR family transcriptional regulator [Clostridium sp. WILCCON 0269]|uniref:TetR/AcrR family transcriptional regulator n=1 Tax=Candidatus Clostridium eludens TaxID=3381663 RepID=A0ABW8SMC8_9CLOT